MYGTMSDLKATKMSHEEKLISLMSNYRSLYDKTDRFYDCNSVRNNQWKEIAGFMNEPGECKMSMKWVHIINTV
jgi:hypothetical protein